jgi:DNA-binding transcriptional regulator YiaG
MQTDLRSLREAAGITAWELALRLGVPDGTVRRWEMGLRRPDGAAPSAQ